MCKNTVREKVNVNKGKLKTTKKNPSNHGLGHIIISSVAEQYGGYVNFFTENGMFGVEVSIPISDGKIKRRF